MLKETSVKNKILTAVLIMAMLSGGWMFITAKRDQDRQHQQANKPMPIPSTVFDQPASKTEPRIDQVDTSSDAPTSSDNLDPLGRPTRGCRMPMALAPNHVYVPALCVAAPLVAEKSFDGFVEVPTNLSTVGWYDQASPPGAHLGSTVLVGHVSYNGAVGALGNLATAQSGDIVIVTGNDPTKD